MTLSAVAAPPRSGPPIGADEAAPLPGRASFRDLLRGLNPLHHLPGVGMIYRAATGESVPAPLRVLGGALVGGPLGAALGALGALADEIGAAPDAPSAEAGPTLASARPGSRAAEAYAAFAEAPSPRLRGGQAPSLATGAARFEAEAAHPALLRRLPMQARG